MLTTLGAKQMACGLVLVGLLAWHEGAVADVSADAAVAIECSSGLNQVWSGSCAGGYYWDDGGYVNCMQAWIDCRDLLCAACGLVPDVDEDGFDCDEGTGYAYCACKIPTGA